MYRKFAYDLPMVADECLAVTALHAMTAPACCRLADIRRSTAMHMRPAPAAPAPRRSAALLEPRAGAGASSFRRSVGALVSGSPLEAGGC